MEFIYDGSHLFEQNETEECLFDYKNGISIWMYINREKFVTKFIVKKGELVLGEFQRISEGEAFIKGMEYALCDKNETEMEKKRSETEIEKLKKENMELRKQKQKTEELAKKLIQGIMKNKGKELSEKLEKIASEI